MTAKGKINASKVQAGDRIIVKVSADGTVRPSDTKTGEGVQVCRVTDKGTRAAGQYEARGKYIVHTSVGSFEAAPIQTMWLAPEDAAGIKRAHVEALVENADREVDLTEEPAEEPVELEDASEYVEIDGQMVRKDGRPSLVVEADHAEEPTEETSPAAPVLDLTGSAVVKLLERVHERIRQNHPEVPQVVIVTGAGIEAFGGKWGHFRAKGWTIQSARLEADLEMIDRSVGHSAGYIHEMFMAGETLAKGSRQVLQTMLHESAHALAEHRGEQDTSRQGRWHNKVFLKTAKELGLEYKAEKADKALGFSQVTLTADTVAEYKDLLDELDLEINLMVRLPGWLGGSSDQDDKGGENMGKAPKGPAAPNTNNIKCVCQCEEPNIIRMSRKVLDTGAVRCGDCDSLFYAA